MTQTPIGALHYVSGDVGSIRLNATGYALWLSQYLLRITNNDISRVNSIATDTCPTMLAQWRNCYNNPINSNTSFSSHAILTVSSLLSKIFSHSLVSNQSFPMPRRSFPHFINLRFNMRFFVNKSIVTENISH